MNTGFLKFLLVLNVLAWIGFAMFFSIPFLRYAFGTPLLIATLILVKVHINDRGNRIRK